MYHAGNELPDKNVQYILNRTKNKYWHLVLNVIYYWKYNLKEK
jgi:hypothetical protein